MNQVSKAESFKRPTHYLADHSLIHFDGTRRLQVAYSDGVSRALGQANRAFERRDNLSDRNVLRRTGQAVTACMAAMRHQEPIMQKDFQKLAYRRQRQLGLRGQSAS